LPLNSKSHEKVSL